MASVYRIAGLKGISALAAVLITLYLTIILKFSIAKGANGMIALVTTLVAATASSIHFHARPHLFTLLFLSVAFWVLDWNRRSAGSRAIWLLVPLATLWANLHGGFVIFLVLLGIRVVGCTAEAICYDELRSARRGEAIQLTLLGFAVAAATLVNPYGYHLHEHIIEFLKSPWTNVNVAEFQSPRFGSEEMLNCMLMLFAGLAVISSLVRKKNLADSLMILFLGYCSLTSVRHMTIFMLAVAPILAVELSLGWNEIAGGRKKSSIFTILHDVTTQLTPMMSGTSLFIPLVIVGLLFMPGLNWPSEIPETTVPVKFIEKHADRIATSRVFAADQVADYLIFRSYPRQKVYFDSRHNYYGPALGDEYLAIRDGLKPWRELLDKNRFDLVLAPNQGALSSLLGLSSDWRLLDQSEKYVLYERKTSM